MLETISTTVLLLVAVYLAMGVAFAVPFLRRGAGQIDPAARRGSLGFRVLVFPGTVALWPILARRWLEARRSPE